MKCTPPAGDTGTRSDPGADELRRLTPGIDVAEGVARLQGNTALYRSLVADFCRNRRGVPRELGEALAAGEMERCRAVVHAVIGVAGNLALTGVYRTACALEEALSRGENAAARDLLPSLESLMAEISSSAARLDAALVPAATAPDASDPVAAAGLLREIRLLTAERNLRALKKAGHLAELLTGTVWALPAAELARLLDRLEFAAAAPLIDALARQLAAGGPDRGEG